MLDAPERVVNEGGQLMQEATPSGLENRTITFGSQSLYISVQLKV